MTLLSAMPLLGEVAAAPTSVLFPLASYWWVYALFTAFVVVVLVVDLGVFHRVPHVMKFREAAAWVVIWVTLAVLFNLGLWIYAEWRLPQMEAANPGFLAAAGYQSRQGGRLHGGRCSSWPGTSWSRASPSTTSSCSW